MFTREHSSEGRERHWPVCREVGMVVDRQRQLQVRVIPQSTMIESQAQLSVFIQSICVLHVSRSPSVDGHLYGRNCRSS